jgi:hypothetical protein
VEPPAENSTSSQKLLTSSQINKKNDAAIVIMPSNTPTGDTIGGRSLSPSNESRFVPRSSFRASPMSASEGERFANDEYVGENNINPPTLIGDDDGDDKSLLVGATICFTPEPSPRSTPLKSPAKRAALDLTPIELESAMSSNATSSDAYIGSIVDGSKVSTNVIHSTSSLDGKSTTEYEILDKSLEIEDLNLDEEEDVGDDGKAIQKDEKGYDGEVSAMLQNMSPTSSLPSLGSKDGGEEADEEGAMTSNTEAATPINVDSSSTDSPKVDDRPLTPFNNLHKFWEGQSITNMSKNIMGCILKQQSPPDPGGSHATEDASLNKDEVGATPAKNVKHFVAAKVNGSLFSAVVHATFSFIVSMSVMVALLSRRCASSTFNVAKYCGQLVVRKDDNAAALASVKVTEQIDLVKTTPNAALSKILGFVFSVLSTAKNGLQSVLHKRNAVAVDPDESDKSSAGQAPVETPSKSKLFSDEPVEDAPKLGLNETEKDSGEVTVPESIDMKEMERLRKINSGALNVASSFNLMANKMKEFAISIGGRICFSFLLAFIIMAELRMFLRNNAAPTVAWDNLLCVDTDAASFDSIPLFEYILSSSAVEATSSLPNSKWVLVFFVPITALASLLYAFFFMKMSYKNGYWSTKEHHQFLKGYAKHGKNWEAVATYVPSRSTLQVKNHGTYWLSIRSPGKTHPFSPKAIKVKKEKGGYVSPAPDPSASDPVKRVKILHSPTLTDPVKRAKMRLLDKGGQDTSEE